MYKVFRLAFICLSFVLFMAAASAAGALDKESFNNFEIVSADKLNYKDGDFELTGNVQIKFGQYLISTPKVLVNANKESSGIKNIEFIKDVDVKSKGLNVKADRIEVDMNTSLMKCFPEETDPTRKVTSVWKNSDDSEEDLIVRSRYQEYNFDTKVGIAKRLDNRDQVVVESKDRLIYSNSAVLKRTNEDASTEGGEAEANNTEKVVKVKQDKEPKVAEQPENKKKDDKDVSFNGVDYITFEGDVVLIEPDKRVECEDLHFWPQGSIIKASEQTKILFNANVEDPLYLFADQATWENSKDTLSAFSKDTSARPVYIYGDQMLGKSRHLVMKIVDGQPDNAVLSGDAFAKFQDKNIAGEEILFNLKDKTMKSIVGRPKTAIIRAGATTDAE